MFLNNLTPNTLTIIPEHPLPGPGRALALAPHPDDPDAVAVTLRLLAQGGWEVHWSILTGAWSGVEDGFVGPSRAAKCAVREEEERAAAHLFGLPDERLAFLRLAETEDGELADTRENRAQFDAHLNAQRPHLVLLPSGADSNLTHRLVFRWLTEWAGNAGYPLTALANEDPKSTAFRPDLEVRFTEETARWKADILECHRSQSARNQRTRQITFAQRILAMNRKEEYYAERFQVLRFGL